MSRSRRLAAVVLAALGAACSEGTGPGDLTTISIRPCAVNAFSPIWFAYRNGDGPWTQVTADAAGRFTFEAESKASVAYSYPGPESQRVTRIVNATAPELALLGNEPCENAVGSATISGTAMTNGSGAMLASMANRSLIVSLTNGQGTWALSQLPPTAAYLGGRPSTWELEMPDLTGAGYQKEWGVAEVPRIWEVEAIKGSLHVLAGGLARKDETVLIGVYRVVQ